MDNIRDTLIDKYRRKILTNITDFRMLRKLATAPKHVDFPKQNARKALTHIFQNNDTNIEFIYNQTVAPLYNEQKFISNANTVLNYIETLSQDDLKDDEELFITLKKIRDQLVQLIGEIE